jgi:hypothetical protein
MWPCRLLVPAIFLSVNGTCLSVASQLWGQVVPTGTPVCIDPSVIRNIFGTVSIVTMNELVVDVQPYYAGSV